MDEAAAPRRTLVLVMVNDLPDRKKLRTYRDIAVVQCIVRHPAPLFATRWRLSLRWMSIPERFRDGDACSNAIGPRAASTCVVYLSIDWLSSRTLSVDLRKASAVGDIAEIGLFRNSTRLYRFPAIPTN